MHRSCCVVSTPVSPNCRRVARSNSTCLKGAWGDSRNAVSPLSMERVFFRASPTPDALSSLHAMSIPSRIAVPDTGGLICGFRLRAQAPAEQLDWRADVAKTGLLPASTEPVWLHFNFVDTRADLWIASCD